MKIYHYTYITCLPTILNDGLSRGEVVVDAGKILNAVNLTTDPDPSGHGLCHAMFLTREDLAALGHFVGDHQPVPAFGDKRKVRITVNLPRSHVRRWYRWACKNVDPHVFDSLVRSGGGMQKARTWYLHWGVIPPSHFAKVEVRERATWIDLSEYTGPFFEVFSDKALEQAYEEWGPRLLENLNPVYRQQVAAYLEQKEFELEREIEKKWDAEARLYNPDSQHQLAEILRRKREVRDSGESKYNSIVRQRLSKANTKASGAASFGSAPIKEYADAAEHL